MSESNTSSLKEIRQNIREGMDEYLAPAKVNVDSANKVQIGRAFTEYYIKKVALVFDNLNDNDCIENGLECDGKNDMGIDFIYEKSENNEFWIYQSKYRGKSSSPTKDELAGFFEIHNSIFDGSEVGKANATVKDLLMGVKKKSFITFVFLTNVLVSDEIKKDFDRRKSDAEKKSKAGGKDNLNWQLIDLSKIKSNYKYALSVHQPPPFVEIPIKTFEKNNPGYINLSKNIKIDDKDYKTIVTVIQGTTLSGLCKEHRNSLFNHNIRGFLGLGGAKNKKIKETLEKSPEKFYLLNNGMSAICSKLDISNSEESKGLWAKCKDFQIINGAQTACSIRDFRDEEKLKKVWVLLRITQAENIKTEKGLNKEIVIANNTQNVIKDADFRSNDPVQLSLEKQIKEGKFQYHTEGKEPQKLIYMPKRTFRNAKKGEIVVSMDSMAKSLFAFTQDSPERLNSQTNFLFDDEEKGSYWEIFGEGGEQTEALLPPTVKKIAAIVILFHFIEKELKKGKDENPSDTIPGMAFRSGRHTLWALGHIIRKCYEQEEGKIYKKILDGAAFDEGGFVREWFDRINLIIQRELEREQDGEDGKALNFKTWFRSKSKTEGLSRELRYAVKMNKIEVK